MNLGDAVSCMADAGDVHITCDCKCVCGVEGVEDDVPINESNTHSNTQHDEQEQQRQALPEPADEGDECDHEPTPSTFLEELAADWPTPAKHATLEDLHRMALVIIAGMPTQQRAKFKCIAEDEYQKKDTEEVDMFSAEALNTPIQTLVEVSMSSDNIAEAPLGSTASHRTWKRSTEGNVVDTRSSSTTMDADGNPRDLMKILDDLERELHSGGSHTSGWQTTPCPVRCRKIKSSPEPKKNSKDRLCITGNPGNHKS